MGTSTVAVPEARRAVCGAEGVVFLTGAGVSAESGVPTFRDRDGLWARFDPEVLATHEAFRRDPRTVWEWYDLRRRAVLECRPNAGHEAVAAFLLAREGATLVTQNVDGLHHRALEEVAATPAELDGARLRILELHGTLFRTRCQGCGVRAWGHDPVDHTSEATLPRCEACDSLLRPDVVWFGEPLDGDTLEKAFLSATHADVCVVAGTSALVHPAASVPLATLEAGGRLVEINPSPTPLSERATWSLRGTAGALLPAILDP